MQASEELKAACMAICPEAPAFKLELCRKGLSGAASEEEAHRPIANYAGWEELILSSLK